MTEKKLYAVTEGDYSEYHIVTLCSNEATARRIVERLNQACLSEYGWKGGYRVEEYIDGEVYKDESLHPYFVRWHENSCEVENEPDADYCFRGTVYTYTDGTVWGIYVFAKDKQEALKIASEKRAKITAERTGVV